MILIGNGSVITRDSSNPFIANGAVLCQDDLIVQVGSYPEMKAQYPDAEFVDAHGGVITCGFINMHNHIYSAFARGLTIKNHNPQNFMDILNGLWWHLDRTLSLKDTYYSACATYLDCIKNGVTTVFDHHASFGSIEGSLFEISKAAKEAGIRTCLCYEVSDRDGKDKANSSIEENKAFINAIAKDSTLGKSDMQYGMVGMHASFTIGNTTLDKCAQLVQDTNTGCHIHVAEGLDDVTACLEQYGIRIVQRLKDAGLLGKKSITAHCIHIDKKEMDLLKETDTMVVHNPESNMGNAVGCSDVLSLVANQICTGLGTDGYTNDMLESYKVGNLLQKHNSGNPNVGWSEIPSMLFDNNPVMANRYFKTPLGKLKPGSAADIIILDYNPLSPLNQSNCNSHMLFGMNGRSVITTIIAGKILMKDRIFTQLDENSIMAHCREQATDLWKRINGE